ncbi:MAG: hypothetical protein JW699_05330, partial [Chitinispirillaceae bacterium]|nr:hypothetical protein [Chitinispirillaceae bacterium]
GQLLPSLQRPSPCGPGDARMDYYALFVIYHGIYEFLVQRAVLFFSDRHFKPFLRVGKGLIQGDQRADVNNGVFVVIDLRFERGGEEGLEKPCITVPAETGIRAVKLFLFFKEKRCAYVGIIREQLRVVAVNVESVPGKPAFQFPYGRRGTQGVAYTKRGAPDRDAVRNDSLRRRRAQTGGQDQRA